jgi:hypothetical protein
MEKSACLAVLLPIAPVYPGLGVSLADYHSVGQKKGSHCLLRKAAN